MSMARTVCLTSSWFVAVALFVAAGGASAAPIGSAGNFIVVSGSGIIEFDGTTGQDLGSFAAHTPSDFAFGNGRLYTTDASDHILVYDAITGADLGSLAGPGTVSNASSIAVDSNGDLILLNQASGAVTVDRFNSTGEFAYTISPSALNDFVLGPAGLLFGTTPADSIVEIDLSDGSVRTVASDLSNPGPIAFLPDGTLVVRDGYGLQRFGLDGEVLGLFSPVFANDIALGPDGNLYVTHASDTVMVLDGMTGQLIETYASPANPSAIAFRPVAEPGFLPALAVACLGLRELHRRRNRSLRF